ncbi:TonB-dependent receptor domain-containing protein, partial [Phenylobacterium sp.]|uniref:TonB-dependent receptor domain-containing protein n=1 Tax=Phenylobacterium sp. TaxID=1871053 RepID=UPI00286C4689
ASYAQGFTMPDVGRVLRAINTPNRDVDTYLDVTPVVSDNTEVGLDYKAGPLQAQAAWFRSTSDRGSLLVLNPGGNFEVQRQRTEVEGIEISAKVAATDWLTVGGSYAHLDGLTDSNGDGAVDRDLNGANISPDRLLLYVEAVRGDWSGRLQAQQFYGRGFVGEVAANRFEGYGLVDAMVSWKAPLATLTLGVQNLLDKQYISYFSDTQGPTDNARYFAGRGRTVAFGVTRDF